MSAQNIRKVYISDSPVEDTVEYSYVSSDVEDDSYLLRQRDMNTNGEMNDVDELAKEGEYQRQLQDRLQKTNIDDSVSR